MIYIFFVPVILEKIILKNCDFQSSKFPFPLRDDFDKLTG
jgi:hypothetical protein